MSSNFEKMLDKYDIEIVYGCVEPGYDDKPVALANWNNIPYKVYKALEIMGYSCEWLDEWVTCGNCYKAIRSSPNSYGWSQYWAWISDCEIICGDCVKENPEEYLETLENNPTKCMTIDVDLENNGYTLMEDDFENGLHQGMDANPKEILKKYQDKYPDGRFIFVLDEPSQFYIKFSIWKKDTE
jgi:hypothetical protein